MKLKKSQKNILFDILNESGLPISLFEYTETEKDNPRFAAVETSIEVKGQPYNFTFFENSMDETNIIICPGMDNYRDYEKITDFKFLSMHFRRWAATLKEEMNTEDKWEGYDQIVQSLELGQIEETSNDRFSASEYQDIQNKMAALKGSLDRLQLPTAQLNIISNRLDDLVEKVTVLGKFDWRSLFVGTMVSLVMQLSLSQEQGKQLWDLIRMAFSAYFIA